MQAPPLLSRLPARNADSGLVNFVVDTPQGSRNKFKYDEKLRLFRLGKVLPLGAAFPYDFGFIPVRSMGSGHESLYRQAETIRVPSALPVAKLVVAD